MKNFVLYQLIRLLIFVMSKIPLKVLMFFSDFIGLIWFNTDKRHRDVVVNNVRSAFPGKYSQSQALGFAKKNFKYTLGLVSEIIWSYGKKTDKLLSYYEIRGREHIEGAMKRGGVILLGGHIGNFELMSGAMARSGIYPVGLYRKFDFAPLERFMLEMRQRLGTTMIPLRNASPKVARALEEKKVVATLLDQNVDWYKGVFVDYFGHPACTNSGLAKLALRSGAAVVPMFIRREQDMFIHEFLPEVSITRTGDSRKDIEINTQAFVSAIESMVRRCPEQYFWVHNRWKTKSYCPI